MDEVWGRGWTPTDRVWGGGAAPLPGTSQDRAKFREFATKEICGGLLPQITYQGDPFDDKKCGAWIPPGKYFPEECGVWVHCGGPGLTTPLLGPINRAILVMRSRWGQITPNEPVGAQNNGKSDLGAVSQQTQPSGPVGAQNVGQSDLAAVGQSDLCALEARSAAAVASMTAKANAESSPLRRSELLDSIDRVANDAYKARLDFFHAKYSTAPNGGRIQFGRVAEEKQFSRFTGKVTRFIDKTPSFPLESPSKTFLLEVALSCTDPRPIVLGRNLETALTCRPISPRYDRRYHTLRLEA
jgi:hypothetical protein